MISMLVFSTRLGDCMWGVSFDFQVCSLARQGTVRETLLLGTCNVLEIPTCTYTHISACLLILLEALALNDITVVKNSTKTH
jgi:hypothetical protein